MNQQQRKYLVKRLDTIYGNKNVEIRNAFKVDLPFVDAKARSDYVNKALKGIKEIDNVVIDTYNMGRNVVTDKDVLYRKAQDAAEKKRKALGKELSKLYVNTMDALMLGEDVEELTAALSGIENFKVD